MATTPEGRVSAALRQAVIRAGGEIRKVMWQGRVGAPDWLIMLNGVAFFAETKAPGCRPRASQILEFDRITATGTLPVLVIDRADVCPRLIDAVVAGTDADIMRVLDEFSYKRYVSIGGRNGQAS